MIKCMSSVFIVLFIFMIILVNLFNFSLFFILFQSIFFNFIFLNSLGDNPECKKSFYNSSYNSSWNFIPVYILYETFFILIFSLFFLMDFKEGYTMMCLFKQGIFPFFMYFFFLFDFKFNFIFLKNITIIFMIFSKVWTFMLYESIVFCLNFYSFYSLLCMIFILFLFNSKLINFLGLGIMFSVIPFGMLCELFNTYFMFIYYFSIILFYFKLFTLLFKSSFFVGSEEVFLSSLFLYFVNGCPMFFILMKFMFLVSLGNYSLFLVVFYIFESLIFTYFFLMYNFGNKSNMVCDNIKEDIFIMFLYIFFVMSFLMFFWNLMGMKIMFLL